MPLNIQAEERFWSKVDGKTEDECWNWLANISGGGYGPLVTGGQVISGVPEKNAIGITSFAEGIVCIVGFILYVSLNGLPQWHLAIPLVIGAMLSVPAATLTVKILPDDLIRKSIGYVTAFLGILTLIKIM